MKCIFCKTESFDSKSVEHIIPESLWNTKHILPAGIVCDQCNNYFSIKVEKPFLNSPAISALRFHQAIPNKKGRIPSLKGMIAGSDKPITAYKEVDDEHPFHLILEPEQFDLVMKQGKGVLYLPAEFKEPDNHDVSRFLAKVAIEALAQRLMPHEGGVDYIAEEEQLDMIRNHARRGTPNNWPYSTRRIYDAETEVENGQIVHEYDFLHTEHNEWYFILAIFGLELAINLGGPEIEGYENWLKENNSVSPLYHGKNTPANQAG